MLPHEAVVAGSPEFVDALLPLVTQRLGGAPRVADTPHLASALCQDGARLLVYEHGGREWLSLCSALRGAAGPELIVVVALPPEHAGDVAEISAAASAVVAWRGEAGPVVEAISRVMAAREASRVPAPATTRRADPDAAAGPGGGPSRSHASAPCRHASSSPRDAGGEAPAATPDPRPPPAGPSRLPPPFPCRPVATRNRPSRPSSTTTAPRTFPPLRPNDRTLRQRRPRPCRPRSGPGRCSPPPTGWPWCGRRSPGSGPEQRLRPVTEKLVAALSTAEKASALGQKLPFDPAPVRRAVGLRWQVAAAIETLPPMGAQVDQGAVQGILGGIDDVLAELKVLSDDAGPEALRALEGVRHALVKEAIDLTEALQQVAPAELVEEITTSRKARRGSAVAVTRMVRTTEAFDDGPRQVPWGLVVVAGAGGDRSRRVPRLSLREPGPKPAPPTISGAPSGTVGTVTPQGKVVVAPPGARLDPKEVENFKNLEKAKGNDVREISPGTFVVTPDRTSGPVDRIGAGQPQQGAKP